MATKKKYTTKDLYKDYGTLSFGEVLRGFRFSDELTQIQFSKKLNISAANLCDLEKGRKVPTPVRAANIAKNLGLSKAFLIQIALQDLLRRENLKFKVYVTN